MPLTMEEKFTITELIYKFNHLMDARDADACMACLTPDFVLEIPEGSFGRDHYRQMLETAEIKIPVQHWTGNIWIEGDAGRATAKTYTLCPEGPRADGSFGVLLMGSVDYSAIRVGGKWLFSRYTIKRDKKLELPKLSAG